MSILRSVGYLGIIVLLAIATFGFAVAFSRRDWYGVFLMTFFFILLVLFWKGLRFAARSENDPSLKEEFDLGWFGESLGSLFRGPILHTPEGNILLIGATLSLIFALLAWFIPTLVGLNPSRSAINATLFTLWPILLFGFYVKFNAPHFRTSLYTILLMLCAMGAPFYLAYK